MTEEINFIKEAIITTQSKALSTRSDLEKAHYETLKKMREAWHSQIGSLKQIHSESKVDLESLIERREKQLYELIKGNDLSLTFKMKKT